MIVGGGTAGTLTANRLDRLYGDGAEIVVVDRDDRHVYQPGLLFVPFGTEEPEGIVRSRRRQLRAGVDLRLAAVDRVETGANEVQLADGSTLPYDVLVIATGSSLLPSETEGLMGPGWGEKVFSFYSLEEAVALARGAERLRSRPPGRERLRHADQVSGGATRVLLPHRLASPRAGSPGAGPDHLRHLARRCVHEGDLQPRAGGPPRREADRARHGVQHRPGGRRGRQADLLRRARGRLRPRGDRAAARRLSVRLAVGRPRRRARVRANGPAHAAEPRGTERIRDRRRSRPPHLEGRLGGALPGRDAGGEHPPLPRR